jgi:hypothetical protein
MEAPGQFRGTNILHALVAFFNCGEHSKTRGRGSFAGTSSAAISGTPNTPSSTGATPPRPPTRTSTVRFSAADLSAAQGGKDCLRPCIEELMATFHNQLRLILYPVVSSKEAYARIKGMQLKTELLKLVIEKNNEFDSRVQPVLRSVGYRCDPKPLLLETEVT